MGKALATLVAASAVLAFSGTLFAVQEFPDQEASVTTTVTDPEGKVLQEDTATDTTKGADTTTQLKALQKEAEIKTGEPQAGEKPAAPAKKKAVKKKSKKTKKAAEKAPPAAPEAK